MKLNNHLISNDRMFIIAEAGVNHDGRFDQAVELIRLAKQCGADAVKFQAFTAEGLCDLGLTEKKDIATLTGGSKSSYQMYKTLEFSNEELMQLKLVAQKENILFFASVFDEARAAFLDEIGVPFFKISSGDLTHLPLLDYVARLGKPLILSTGMGTIGEITKAVQMIEKTGCKEIILLHCTSDYPPKDTEVNLKAILTMQRKFSYPIGYSDHTVGLEVPFALAGMQIPVLEKHFTIDENLPGPDHKLSLGPENFSKMVKGIRKIERAMGTFEKRPTQNEQVNILTTRRGLKAARNIQVGETISPQNVRFIKPAEGLSPEQFEKILGKKVKRSILINEPIQLKDLV